MHQSLLAHVAAGHSQKENLATSALAYILNSSADCRTRLAGLLSQASGSAVGGIARVRTEEALEAGGRPDVRLLGDGGTLRGFMEVKFWAGLTDAQPIQYLKALREHQDALLVVLAPDRRLAALREELVARCEGTVFEAKPDRDFLLNCGGVRLVLIAWSQLTNELALAASGDQKVHADVDQLRGLCSLIDEEDAFSMSREELSDIAGARRVRMLNRLVDAMVGRLEGSGLADRTGLKVAHQEWGYGRYFRTPHVEIWVGVDSYSWVQYGHGPLWGIVSKKHVDALDLPSALGGWIRGFPARAFLDDETGRLLLPLPMQPGAVKEELLAGFVDFFDRLTSTLDAAGFRRPTDD